MNRRIELTEMIEVQLTVQAMWRANRGTVSGYFLAGRKMWFLPVGTYDCYP